MPQSAQEQALFLSLNNITVSKNNQIQFENLDWQILNNENWVITGPSGSGKSTLGATIAGHNFIRKGNINYYFLPQSHSGPILDSIIYIAFSESSSSFNYSNYYYQQRFNATESDNSLTVRNYLQIQIEELDSKLIETFGLKEILDREFIKLSNGQTRKVRMVSAILRKPRLLILDDPFAGLDSSARSLLKQIIDDLSKTGIKLILITNDRDFPSCITHILELDSFKIKGVFDKNEFLETVKTFSNKSHEISVFPFSSSPTEHLGFNTAVKFDKINIIYGNKTILKDIDWTIDKGDKWALLGPNGAGKSTLLSLINADHPQAYSQRMWLFDKLRGSGESIWDIKKRIGFLSPELHLYFNEKMTAREVVATGFLETLFLTRKISAREENTVTALLHYLNIDSSQNTSFLQLGSGEQRKVLFLRALAKNPDLLILDEPFHGMDEDGIYLCNKLIGDYCKPEKTLIFVTHIKEEIPNCVNKYFHIANGLSAEKDYRIAI